MSNLKCELGNPDFQYMFCPSYPASITFAVLFSITTVYHVWQGYSLRKPFTIVLIMGGLWEMMGYIVRTISIQNPFTSGLYTAQMLLILLAPLWINAFIYMVMGRMIHFFLDDDRIFGIKARKITMIFVAFDFIAFVVQGTGGSMTTSTDLSSALTGLNIYTGGVALQIVFNAIFLAIVGRFHKIAMTTLHPSKSTEGMRLEYSNTSPSTSPERSARTQSRKDCIHLLIVVYTIIAIILIRNFYRLAEFSSGLNNTILTHEWYAYVFDAAPMLIALVLLNVLHPSTKLTGPRSDFTEENRARKQARKERKSAGQGSWWNVGPLKKPNVSVSEISADNQV